MKRYIETEQYQNVIKETTSLLSTDLDLETRGLLLQLLADAYYYENDIEKSLEAYLKAIEVFHQNEGKPALNLTESYSHAGFCFRELGQYGKSLHYYNEALKFAIQLQDSAEVATQNSNLGTVYAKLGDLDLSSKYFRLAYEIDIARKDSSALGFDLRNLGELYALSGNHEEAIVHYQQSLEFLRAVPGNHNSYALRLGSIGKSFLAIGHFDSARHYLQSSIAELERLGDSLNTSIQWIQMANLEFELKNQARAIAWAQKAEVYLRHLEEGQHLISVYQILARIYLSNSQNELALSYAEKNIELATQQNLPADLRDALLLRATALERTGDFRNALESYKSYKGLSDKVINENTKRSIEELKIRYDVDRIAQSNEILALENAVTRASNERKSLQLAWLIAVLLLAVSASVAITLALISRHKLKQKLLIQEVNELRLQIRGILESDPKQLNIQKQSLNNNLVNPLSDREFEILSYAISDLTNSEIAEKVFVSANTVKFHLKNVYEKLGVGNRKEALKFALNTTKS